MPKRLNELCEAWRTWARSAKQSEDGWESDFPSWNELMACACEAMVNPAFQNTYFSSIEFCWELSEESETLAEFAKAHIEIISPILVQLAKSKSAKVRWQVFAVLPWIGQESRLVLWLGLEDPVAYCRQRALLALAELDPATIPELQIRMRQDRDPYVRQVAENLHLTSTHEKLRNF